MIYSVLICVSFVGLRAESHLLKEHAETQSKEISQRKHRIEELEEKERQSNENVIFLPPHVINTLYNDDIQEI